MDFFTSSHVVEPRYPAAVDRYVDLGRFYDLTAAKAAALEVKACTRAYQNAYVRAYRSLKAARQVELEAAERAWESFDGERGRRRAEGIAARELNRRGGQSGKTTRRFLGSITHKGYVWRFDSVDTLCRKVYVLIDRWGLAGGMLEQLRQAAVERGWDTIACAAPEEPTRLEHLLVPGLELGFITSRRGMEYPGKPYRRIRLDAMADPGNRGRLRFQERMTQMLRADGVNALREAKAAHDALEAQYNPYVDFDGVRALAALEAGRLLAFMR